MPLVAHHPGGLLDQLAVGADHHAGRNAEVVLEADADAAAQAERGGAPWGVGGVEDQDLRRDAGIMAVRDDLRVGGVVRVELLVRGEWLDVGFTPAYSIDVPTARREFAAASPPASVEVHPVDGFGPGFRRVHLDAYVPFPFESCGACWQAGW